MEVINYTPQGKTSLRLPFEEIKLMPLGDIQAGIEACDLDLLEENVAIGMDADSYFIGMGDYLDVASPSNRRIMKSAGFYDSVNEMMDRQMRWEEQELLKILAPTKGRWFGMVTGHHWWPYQDGTTSDTNLCRALGATHLGSCGLVTLKFRDDSGRSTDCTIFAHHGVGSGNGPGAPLLKLKEAMTWAEADIYLMGHQHKSVSATQPRFYTIGHKDPLLLARQRRLVGTGSYLKGYMQGSKVGGIAEGGYVEKAMMTPVGLGSPLISILPRRIRKDGHDYCELKMKVTT